MRTWESNPQFYADILASSLAGQALFTHAPAAERARRVLSKLRQTPRLIQAARDNIKDPPGIFVKVGIETMRGRAEVHRRRAAARVRRRRRSAPARRPRRRADRSVAGGRRRTSQYLEDGSWRRARARRSASAATSSSRSCGSTKGITVPVDRLLAIADARAEGDAGGVQVAGRPDERRRSAGGVGAHESASIRRRASSSPSAAQQLDELATFLERQSIITLPPASRSPSRRRPTSTAGRSPACGRRVRSRRKPTRAYYYLTDVDPSWPRRASGRAPARLQLPDAVVDLDPRGLSRATSCTTSTCAASSRRRASRSCSRRRRSSKAGRTTASR